MPPTPDDVELNLEDFSRQVQDASALTEGFRRDMEGFAISVREAGGGLRDMLGHASPLAASVRENTNAIRSLTGSVQVLVAATVARIATTATQTTQQIPTFTGLSGSRSLRPPSTTPTTPSTPVSPSTPTPTSSSTPTTPVPTGTSVPVEVVDEEEEGRKAMEALLRESGEASTGGGGGGGSIPVEVAGSEDAGLSGLGGGAGMKMGRGRGSPRGGAGKIAQLLNALGALTAALLRPVGRMMGMGEEETTPRLGLGVGVAGGSATVMAGVSASSTGGGEEEVGPTRDLTGPDMGTPVPPAPGKDIPTGPGMGMPPGMSWPPGGGGGGGGGSPPTPSAPGSGGGRGGGGSGRFNQLLSGILGLTRGLGALARPLGAFLPRLGVNKEETDKLQAEDMRTFAMGTAGIAAGMYQSVGAISPSAISTLQGSFTMLSQEIGKQFVPVIDKASESLRDLAKWYGGLDDTTRTVFARIATGTVVFGGMMIAVRGLAFAVAGLRGAFTTLFVAGQWLWRNPIALAISGIATAALYLTGTLDKVVDAATAAGGAIGGMVGAAGTGPGAAAQAAKQHLVTADQIRGILGEELSKKVMAGGTPQDQAGMVDKFIKEQEEVRQKLQHAQLAGAAEEKKITDILKAAADSVKSKLDILNQPGPTGLGLDEDKRTRLAADIQKQARDVAAAEFRRAGIVPQPGWIPGATNIEVGKQIDKWTSEFLSVPRAQPQPVNLPLAKEIERLGKVIADATGLREKLGLGGMAGDKQLENIVLPFQSKMLGYAEYGNQLQMSALATDDLNRRNMLEQLKEIMKKIGDGNQFLTKLDNMKITMDAMLSIFQGNGMFGGKR